LAQVVVAVDDGEITDGNGLVAVFAIDVVVDS